MVSFQVQRSTEAHEEDHFVDICNKINYWVENSP